VSRKPLSIALEEIAVGKITFHRLAEGETEDGAGPVGLDAPAS
jgi:DNA-directed RNA polymerase subunit K/omega